MDIKTIQNISLEILNKMTPKQKVIAMFSVLLLLPFMIISCSCDDTWAETHRKPIQDYHSNSGSMFGEYWSAQVKILIVEENEDGERRAFMIPFKGKWEEISLIHADYLLQDGVNRL